MATEIHYTLSLSISLLLHYTESLCRFWLHRGAVICKDWIVREKKPELKLNRFTVEILRDKSTGKKYNILQPSGNVFLQYIFLEASEGTLLSL